MENVFLGVLEGIKMCYFGGMERKFCLYLYLGVVGRKVCVSLWLARNIYVNVSLGKENCVWKHFGRITYDSRCSLVF